MGLQQNTTLKNKNPQSSGTNGLPLSHMASVSMTSTPAGLGELGQTLALASVDGNTTPLREAPLVEPWALALLFALLVLLFARMRRRRGSGALDGETLAVLEAEAVSTPPESALLKPQTPESQEAANRPPPRIRLTPAPFRGNAKAAIPSQSARA